MKPFLRHIRRVLHNPPRTELPLEVNLPALEEAWTVRYRRTRSRWVQARCNGNGVLAVSGRVDDGREVVNGLRRWLSRQARNSLVPWLDELSALAALPYGRVSVRGQRTRWASCSTRGDINLNYRLLFLPPEVVRYILHHELCHTVHSNHSRDFWYAVASLEPGYRHLNGLAKRGMEMVPGWAKD